MGKNWKDKWDSGSGRKTKARDHDSTRQKRVKKRETEGRETGFVVGVSDWDKVLRQDEEHFLGAVVEVHKRYCFISALDESGEIDTSDVWLATIARRHLQGARKERNFVSVGDVVLCKAAEEHGVADVSEDLPSCTVEHRKERVNALSRIDPLKQELKHVLAANLDQLVIVASIIDPKVKWGLIDRYLTIAESESITPVIILTKKDLYDASEQKKFKDDVARKVALYRSLSYDVHLVQANEDAPNESKDLIRQVFSGKVSVVSGHSGVGKSSIVNLLSPEIEQDVEVDEIFYKGRHTTTYASMIRIADRGFVIDTPGIRSFMIEDNPARDLAYYYRDIRPFLGKCKYRECRHIEEPGCAIREAVSSGEIEQWRYKSFLALLLGASGREGRLRDIDIEES